MMLEFNQDFATKDPSEWTMWDQNCYEFDQMCEEHDKLLAESPCRWACTGCDICGSKGHGESWF